MATTNDITGDLLVSKSSEAYRDNYDRIFRKKAPLKVCYYESITKRICSKCGQYHAEAILVDDTN